MAKKKASIFKSKSLSKFTFTKITTVAVIFALVGSTFMVSTFAAANKTNKNVKNIAKTQPKPVNKAAKKAIQKVNKVAVKSLTKTQKKLLDNNTKNDKNATAKDKKKVKKVVKATKTAVKKINKAACPKSANYAIVNGQCVKQPKPNQPSQGAAPEEIDPCLDDPFMEGCPDAVPVDDCLADPFAAGCETEDPCLIEPEFCEVPPEEEFIPEEEAGGEEGEVDENGDVITDPGDEDGIGGEEDNGEVEGGDQGDGEDIGLPQEVDYEELIAYLESLIARLEVLVASGNIDQADVDRESKEAFKDAERGDNDDDDDDREINLTAKQEAELEDLIDGNVRVTEGCKIKLRDGTTSDLACKDRSTGFVGGTLVDGVEEVKNSVLLQVISVAAFLMLTSAVTLLLNQQFSSSGRRR